MKPSHYYIIGTLIVLAVISYFGFRKGGWFRGKSLMTSTQVVTSAGNTGTSTVDTSSSPDRFSGRIANQVAPGRPIINPNQPAGVSISNCLDNGGYLTQFGNAWGCTWKDGSVSAITN